MVNQNLTKNVVQKLQKEKEEKLTKDWIFFPSDFINEKGFYYILLVQKNSNKIQNTFLKTVINS